MNFFELIYNTYEIYNTGMLNHKRTTNCLLKLCKRCVTYRPNQNVAGFSIYLFKAFISHLSHDKANAPVCSGSDSSPVSTPTSRMPASHNWTRNLIMAK